MKHRFNLNDCVRLAEFAHFHQRDSAGHEYIDHPKRVLASVQAQGAQPYVQMAAVLHDVTEDTPFTPEMLLAFGVPEAAVEIVKLVDRNISRDTFRIMDPFWEGYANSEPGFKVKADEYYYTQIRQNPGALQVKLADIGDNLQPWRLSYFSDERQNYLREKYAKALRYLT